MVVLGNLKGTGKREWENSSGRVKLHEISTLLALPSFLSPGQ